MPKPTALKVLRGDAPSRINRDEPPADTRWPVCPDDVTKEVRAIWNYTLDQMIRMGITSSADRDSLLAYCEAVALHREASKDVAAHGVLIPGHRGVLVRNPACAVQREAAAQIRQFAHEFGLTPASRSDIKMSNLRPSTGPDAGRYLTG